MRRLTREYFETWAAERESDEYLTAKMPIMFQESPFSEVTTKMWEGIVVPNDNCSQLVFVKFDDGIPSAYAYPSFEIDRLGIFYNKV